MATTEARVCNIALLRVGITQFIGSLGEATTEANVCNQLWEDARDAVLEARWWRFATRRSVLSLLTSVTRSGWGFVYSLPTDCVAPRFIWNGMRNPPAQLRVPFTMELNDAATAKVLLTDMEDAELIYTRRVGEVGLFPALFVNALAWKLAADLALALPVKPQVGLAMQQGYARALAEAAVADFDMAQEDLPPESETIRERG